MSSYIIEGGRRLEGETRELRSSVILAGAILARFKNAVFTYLGGYDFKWIHWTSIR